MNGFHKIIGVIFFIINFCFILVSTKIAEMIVALSRLDESKGYMITEAEEFKLFLFMGIPMLVIQFFFLLFFFIFLKKKLFKKSSIILNLLAHFLLLFWFIFNVYQFTINGY
ncbi:hypothetical protein [Bacillus sp. FJAT-27245]|uniref:hypothetical protein n=1 Tax=Bacillus sp. FJAT-27245 TaxID=1684144 RepID=UPI0006A7EDB3|nr:hypothetical protein [Bacillus sp. FJAT-27245]